MFPGDDTFPGYDIFPGFEDPTPSEPRIWRVVGPFRAPRPPITEDG